MSYEVVTHEAFQVTNAHRLMTGPPHYTLLLALLLLGTDPATYGRKRIRLLYLQARLYITLLAGELDESWYVNIYRTAGHTRSILTLQTPLGFRQRLLSIGVRRPTLDDVFLKLTGRAIRDQEADAAEQMRGMMQRRRS